MSVTAFSPDVAASLTASAGTSSSSSTASATGSSKEVFLQLLVAQIKNQNPLNPSDGVEFMSQLAQFTQLEQTMSMKEDLAAIRSTLEASAAAAASAGSSSSSSGSSPSTTQP
jgi:flagellar basal-body rod modification protein FlgD